jgi:serine/threonine protein kinase
MSEIDFLNTEPEKDGAAASRSQEKPEHRKEEEPFNKKEVIHSNEFADIKPFCASRYGNSRLFTAKYNGKKVVIKTLKADRANDAKYRASLRQEYDVTSMLDNKFIRKAIDFVQIGGLGDCIVFEFIEGKSLAEHVRVGTLSEKQVKSILTDVCDGLLYLHRNQVIHCNLKPENIIVTGDCRAKIIDIGIPETDPDADRELLIKEMEFVAPEIIKGEDIDNRADVYSLGKIMEFLGERNITKQFVAVATHSTQFSKEQRYDSISEVRSAITKGHPVVKTIIIVLILALLGFLAYIYVPKIKANVERERAERMAVDFAREVDVMRNELPSLCEKYQLKSLNESVAVNWKEDSLRYVQSLMPFFGAEDYQNKALQALKEQRNAIESSRKKDFNRILLGEFKNANDSLALVLKTPLVDPTDEQLLIEAQKWYNQMK